MSRPIALASEVDSLLAADAAVAIGVSGGKDSQAAALATVRHLNAIGHAGPTILIHADLGTVEWNDSLPTCSTLARHLGVELVVARRRAGDLMDRWESRWESSKRRYVNLETVTLVPCWSTPAMRFCTSELKTHIITAELKRRFKGQRIINVTGVRRDESSARARGLIASEGEGGIWNWRPISDWRVDDVFSYIAASGLSRHPAYDAGMSRVSCRFCIMSSHADLTAAAAIAESHDLYRRMVALEISSTFAFQGSRWLGEVAPNLLGVDQERLLQRAKAAARARVAAERQITPAMLYEKGWPTRMLTDAEADLLASVRNEVGALIGIAPLHLDRESIHGRYAELLTERAEKEAAAA